MGLLLDYMVFLLTSVHKFIIQHGEISYSLKISEELLQFLQINKIDENDSAPREYSFSEDRINNALRYKPIRELICSLICQKNKKSVERQELIFDLAAVLAGFIPVVGSIIGVAFKYLYKNLIKYISNKLENQLTCSLCEQID